jgi:hypothetical protein
MWAARIVLTFNHLRRRVSITHKHGSLVVQIARHSDRALYIVFLLVFTAAFVFFCYIFVSPFFRRPFSSEGLYVLPFLAFILLWYLIGLRLAVWRAFGVEKIVVDGGILCWTRTALWWKRRLEISTKDITHVKAVTPWHALSNRVEFTALGRRRTIGDMLLRDESAEVAHALNGAIGVAG